VSNKPDPLIVPFASPEAWEAWLDENHAVSDGLWLKIAKKGSGIETVSFAEALDVALCYGWIDSQADSFDERYWLQRFTPRRPRSKWSKRNRAKVTKLIEEGRMKPAGLREVERAKADGRWEAAYEPQSTATVPEDFRRELEKNEAAREFFATHARQREQVRDPAPNPGRQEARDAGTTHRKVRGDAEPAEEALPLRACPGCYAPHGSLAWCHCSPGCRVGVPRKTAGNGTRERASHEQQDLAGAGPRVRRARVWGRVAVGRAGDEW
jgi:uncharacterized protein YdeI (YjbR/CyaY-like superfamily)